MSGNLPDLDGLSPEEARSLLERMLRQAIEPTHPLSYNQRSMWFLQNLDPQSAAYNLNFAATIRSAYDVGAMRSALQTMINRHAVLRTVFVAEDGMPLQQVREKVEPPFQVVDASAWDDTTLGNRVAEEAYRPFQLDQSPLVRFWLFVRGPQAAVLLSTFHHIISDFWSSVLFMEEFSGLYRATAAGREMVLPSVRLQYTDFVRWQSEIMNGQEGDRLWAYWRERLPNDLPVLCLPTDRPRGPVQTFHGDVCSFAVDEVLTERLWAVANEVGVTPLVLLLSAFQVLLYRHSGQEHFLVGTPTLGRTRPEFANVIGYFVNPVPIRADLSPDLPFTALVGRVSDMVLGALDHQDFPFPLLVDRLHPRREPGYPPLIQVMFNFEKSHEEARQGTALFITGQAGAQMNMGGLELESYALQQRIASFDLELVLEKVNGRLWGALQYNSDLFDRTTVLRMAKRFQTLLSGIAEAPDRPVADLPLLTADELRQLAVWNRTDVIRAPGLSPVHQVAEQARLRPDATAIMALDGPLTYRELNRQADVLAAGLQQDGLAAGCPVGIRLSPSPAAAVALLAVLKAGGVCLPLDPNEAPQRQAHMLHQAGAEVLLTSGRFPTVEVAGVRCIDLDQIDLVPGGEPATILPHTVSDDQPAFLFHRPGPGGQPQALPVSHRALCNRLDWLQETFQLTEADRVLHSAPLTSAAALRELLWPLTVGARVVCAGQGDALEGRRMTDLVATRGITVLSCVPSVLAHMLDEQDPVEPGRLRLIMCSGEPMSQALAQKAADRFHAAVHSLYSTAGAGGEALHWHCASTEAGQLPLLGRPIANVRAHILDGRDRPVPVGVTGDLCIGFAGSATLFKTGDRARQLPSGIIAHAGRSDGHIRLLGHRVDPEEVRAVLAGHPAVGAVELALQERGGGDAAVVAYVVPRDKGALRLDDLRTYLRERLPTWMMPAAFRRLDELPLTPDGRVDHAALPVVPEAVLEPERPFVVPRTPLEAAIAAVWCEVLAIPRVSVHADFFRLGGEAPEAGRIISVLQERLQVSLPPTALYESPTIADLAAQVSILRSRLEAPAISVRNDAARSGSLQLSPRQQLLWITDQSEGHRPGDVVPILLRAAVPLDGGLLERSLQALVQRHEVLRMGFRFENGAVAGFAQQNVCVPLQRLDMLETAPDRWAEALDGLISREVRQPFDMTLPPLLRATWVRLSDTESAVLLVLHAMVADEFSGPVIARDLGALYVGLAKGDQTPLPEPAFGHADYVGWQVQRVGADACEAELAYWKAQLDGAPPLLELPTDRARPPVQSYRAKTLRFAVADGMMTALADLGRQVGVSAEHVWLAALQTVLHRYSGENDICIGAWTPGRLAPETEKRVGPFANRLALRTNLSGNPTFRELLRRLREVAFGGYRHQNVSYQQVLEALQVVAGTSNAPLCQVGFSYAVTRPERPATRPFVLEPVGRDWLDLDLSLRVTGGSEGVTALLDYNPDLFDDDRMQRLAAHLQNLLAGAVADPDEHIWDLPLLTEAERQQILVTWNDTAVPFPQTCLHNLVAEQVQRTPHAVAAVMGEAQLTYAELDVRANQLAHHLQALGVGPDVPVGVCVERSLEMAVVLLAILKAGGAYVPLDTDAPTARLRQVLTEAGAPVCVSQDSLRSRLPDDVATKVMIDADRPVIASRPRSAPHTDVTPDHLVSVYYTSGSTGRPKGVASTHAGWVNRVVWMQRQHKLCPGETVLQKTTLTFDDAAVEFFWPLTTGGRIAFLEPALHKDPRAILAAAIHYDAAVLQFVPSMLTFFLDAIGPADAARLKKLRHVVSSGEALKADLVRKFFERLTCPLHNQWGATEVSIDSTLYTCRSAADAITPIVPVGRPFDNNQAYILDPYGHPVPAGVVGELYLAGIGLARGYLNDPVRTAEAFMDNPFDPGTRMYRTGDRGYYMPNGCIVFAGRRDDQVKVRGQRVELAEIEAALDTCPEVQECAVVAHKRTDGYRLAAYYTVRPARADGAVGWGSVESLRGYLSGLLPDYMVPGRFIPMATLPHTVSGKVDRKLLPEPTDERPDLQQEYVTPQTETETAVAAVWQGVLGLAAVGAQDDFFELGGHSLDATRVISRINQVFGVSLPLKALFEKPNVAALAALVQDARSEAADGDRKLVPPAPPQSTYELSHAQLRYWFQYLYDRENAAGILSVHELKGPLEAEALLRAFQALVNRHGIMRTTFADQDGTPVQIVHADLPVPCPYVDLSGLTPDEQFQRLAEHAAAEWNRPYELERESSFRASLFKLALDRHFFFLGVHPISYDGWSATVLTRDLAAFYRAYRAGLSDEMPPAVQYIDFALWQNRRLAAGELDQQRDYWRKHLAVDTPAPRISSSNDETPTVPAAMVPINRTIPAEQTARIRAFAREHGVTLYMTMLCALNLWLARRSGQSIITVGTPLSGRNHPDLESILGLVLNPVTIRTNLSGNPTFLQALDVVRQAALDAHANQDYPFDLIQHEYRQRTGATSPLYTVVFVVQNAYSGEAVLDGLDVRDIPIHSFLQARSEQDRGMVDPTMEFDLHIEAIEQSDVVELVVQYHPKRYSRATVDRFLQEVESVLTQMIEQPGQRLSQLRSDDDNALDELFGEDE
ncbi:MAG TPA: amino acid adenylation domain-containing protein [Symbiobacteriaceae bacterium]|jgi:amino acid adenylation domain-containing protein